MESPASFHFFKCPLADPTVDLPRPRSSSYHCRRQPPGLCSHWLPPWSLCSGGSHWESQDSVLKNAGGDRPCEPFEPQAARSAWVLPRGRTRPGRSQTSQSPASTPESSRRGRSRGPRPSASAMGPRRRGRKAVTPRRRPASPAPAAPTPAARAPPTPRRGAPSGNRPRPLSLRAGPPAARL